MTKTNPQFSIPITAEAGRTSSARSQDARTGNVLRNQACSAATAAEAARSLIFRMLQRLDDHPGDAV